jgi:hypothetical protein
VGTHAIDGMDRRHYVSPAIAPLEFLTEESEERLLGSYDGVAWHCWIARGDDVRAVEVTSKRLLW